MKLIRLALNNIRSYKYQEIDFPSGATLLAGDVGAGKTTLLLAIEYALFGLQPGQRGTSLLTNGEEEGSVTLELEIEGNRIEIQRTLKRSSKGVSQDECFLTVNCERREMAVTELKTRILELMNYPSEFLKKTNLLYKYTVYSPQEEMKSIILEDSEMRLNILRTIFGIEKYRRIKENSVLIAARLREQTRILQAQSKGLENYESLLQTIEKTIVLAEEEIVNADKEVLSKKELRKNIEKELTSLKEKVDEHVRLEKELEKANVQYSNTRSSLSETEKELEKATLFLKSGKYEFDENRYKQTLNTIQEERKVLELVEKDIIDSTSKIRSLESRQIEDLEKKKRIFSIDICPTCLQDVPESHKHNILNESESKIVKSEKEKKDIELELNNARKKLEASKQKILSLEATRRDLELTRARAETISHTRKRAEDLEKMKISLGKDIVFLDEHITSIKKTMLDYAKFKTQASLKESEVRKAFSEEKASEIKHAEKKKEREFLLREKERLKKEMREKRELHQKAVDFEKFESWLSGSFTELISIIERNVLIRVREEFSRLFNKWFSLLTTDAFTVRLDENFTPIILQREFELDYAFLSGGERTAVALAYRLALNQILNTIHSNIKTRDIIILDEPTDGFSEQQLDKVRDILRELKVAQLIVVSHEPKMESFVDNVIRIRKDTGYSAKA